MLNKVFLVLKTLSYLKPTQLIFLFIRRILPTRITRVAYHVEINPDFKLAAPISTDIGDDEYVCFVGSSMKIDFESINWYPQSESELWCFNLHYFDYLRDRSRSENNKHQFIDSWLQHCPQQSRSCAWHPYTNSLRVVNWLFFFTSIPSSEIKQQWIQSLYEQVIYIENNDERDLLANHYFENIKAILFASIFFQGETAQRWRIKASRLLRVQLEEQFLPDGGHFERSPQYHALMLENCLDIYNLLAHNRDKSNHALKKTVQSYCELALQWLADMHYESDEIAFFNDSANGIAPRYQDLYDYAVSLFRYQQEANIISSGRLIDLSSSGYYGVECPQDKFIIDCGEVQPSYQPGHMQCDLLSYELVLNDRKLIVNPGVFEYTAGAMRDYVRSTQAHNTVSVSDHQQSEIWSAFRVARRAKKLYAQIQQAHEWVYFSGAFEGFPTLQGGAQHQRDIKLLVRAGQLVECHVDDTVTYHGTQNIKNRIHLHPEIQVTDCGAGLLQCSDGKNLVASIKLASGCDYNIESSYYCPQFGQKIMNKCIVMNQSGHKKMQMNYSIVRNG